MISLLRCAAQRISVETLQGQAVTEALGLFARICHLQLEPKGVTVSLLCCAAQSMFVETLRGQALSEALDLVARIEDFVLEVAFEFNTDKLGVKGMQTALQR